MLIDNLKSIVKYGTTNAIKNPESYTFFALAYYLGQKYPDYTFASSKSAQKSKSSKPPLLLSAKDTLLAFQPEKKDVVIEHLGISENLL